jgi:hypothetical protein
VKIYQTLPAPPTTAAWLSARLQPVVEACKFAKSVPLEIRPTGKWGGWCADTDSARDGRICISSKVVFWSSDRLKEVFLHEASHRLLSAREVASHGPEFFALTATLYMRASQFFEGEALHFLSIYDLQDVVEIYRGEVLNWALKAAEKLSATDKSAEELADEVCRSWAENVKEKEAKKLQIAREKAAHINIKREVKNINTKLFLWRALSAIGWGGMFAAVYFSIR